MKKLFHSHPSIVIGTLALAFIVVLAAFYWWAINDVIAELRVALVSPAAQSISGFDFADAEKLGLSGVTSSSPVSTPVSVPTGATTGASTTGSTTTGTTTTPSAASTTR